MLSFYVALKAYKMSIELEAKDEIIEAFASELKKEYDKLETWEKDMISEVCCADVSDVLY